MASLSDILQGGLGAFADYYTSQRGIESARQIGTTAQQLAEQYGQDAANQAKFKPFALSTGTGGVKTNASGGFTSSLSPQMQAATEQLRAKGLGMLGGVGNIGAAQADIFQQLRATRQPEIERARLQLEERLFNQGRSGVRTSMFGGTPEQLAMEKAIQEQGSADFFTARNQALGEEMQAAKIGSGLFDQSFTPENQLLSALQASTPLSELVTRGNQQGVVTQAELRRAGLDGLLQGETIASNLQQAQLQALLGLLQGEGADGSVGGGGGLLGWGADQISGLFNDWFGEAA